MRAACRRRQGPKILKNFGKIFFEKYFEIFFRKTFSDRWPGVNNGWARRAVWWLFRAIAVTSVRAHECRAPD